MLDWNKELKTEPPLISRLSDDEVTRILDNPLEVPDWCNNTQERAIKAVTESCTAVTGAGHRNRYTYPATETFTENHAKIQHQEGLLQQHIEPGMNLLYAQ